MQCPYVGICIINWMMCIQVKICISEIGRCHIHNIYQIFSENKLIKLCHLQILCHKWPLTLHNLSMDRKYISLPGIENIAASDKIVFGQIMGYLLIRHGPIQQFWHNCHITIAFLDNTIIMLRYRQWLFIAQNVDTKSLWTRFYSQICVCLSVNIYYKCFIKECVQVCLHWVDQTLLVRGFDYL